MLHVHCGNNAQRGQAVPTRRNNHTAGSSPHSHTAVTQVHHLAFNLGRFRRAGASLWGAPGDPQQPPRQGAKSLGAGPLLTGPSPTPAGEHHPPYLISPSGPQPGGVIAAGFISQIINQIGEGPACLLWVTKRSGRKEGRKAGGEKALGAPAQCNVALSALLTAQTQEVGAAPCPLCQGLQHLLT